MSSSLAREAVPGSVFALLLKFFTLHGRFPSDAGDYPPEVVDFVGRQVGVDAAAFASYEWRGSSAGYHRSQIRRVLGVRECSVQDSEKLTDSLAADVCESQRDPGAVRIELLARCRDERIEPPSAGRVERLVRTALHRAEQAMTGRIAQRLPPEAAEALDHLLVVRNTDREAGESPLGLILSESANVSLESMLAEIEKLRLVRSIQLPPDLFAGISPRVVAGWRSRAAVESPSHLRSHPADLRLTLMAALVEARVREITDTLVDLLISTVHRIGARAARKVTDDLVNAFRRVTGKENILFSIAEASLAAPDEPVRQVVYPAVSGGAQTLRDLVHE